MIVCKSMAEIRTMDTCGRIVLDVLEGLRAMAEPGVTGADLDRYAEAQTRRRGATPAFKGYHGYPASLCLSINDEVVHGIPSQDKVLQEGDVVSIDFGVVKDGFYGDSDVTFALGEVEPRVRELIETAEQAFYAGMEAMQEGAFLSDVSHRIQQVIESHDFGIVRDYVGHGIGTALHEEPQVPNFGEPGRGIRLKPGLVLALEPMVTERGPTVQTLPDQWTVVTMDGGRAAHFERSVALLPTGPVIMGTDQLDAAGA